MYIFFTDSGVLRAFILLFRTAKTKRFLPLFIAKRSIRQDMPKWFNRDEDK